MDIPNAFVGITVQPTEKDIYAALGPSATTWKELVDWLARELGVAEQEWKSSSPKYGWSLRLKLKKRTIIYLGPCNGCFRASFVLGDKAVAATRTISLPKPDIKLIDEAPHYAEGTGLRLIVKTAKDLAAIRILALIKLPNCQAADRQPKTCQRSGVRESLRTRKSPSPPQPVVRPTPPESSSKPAIRQQQPAEPPSLPPPASGQLRAG